MLIGSRFEARHRGAGASAQSAHWRADRGDPEASAGADRCGRRRRREGIQDLVAHDAGAALGLSAQDRRAHRGRCRGPSRRSRRSIAASRSTRCSTTRFPAIVDCWRFFAGAVRNMHGAVAGEYLPGHTSMIRRDPIGIVGSIAPWNYPLMMMAWKLAPALAGGNTVVFKPSEQTPLTALKLAKVIADILPEGVVNVMLGRGASVGNALINHPRINMISITGDIGTGKKVLAGGRANPSSARISNSAARRRSSSMTTPISRPWSQGSGASATTMPGRIARPPAASMPARKSTTSSSPTSAPPSPR